MKRRQLLAALALGGTLSAAWAGRVRAWLAPAGGQPPTAALLALLSGPESAAAVGNAYLMGHPAEADARGLSDRLASALRAQDCDPATAPTPQLRAALARHIRADFAQGQVVKVDGWVLSLSEARLCALAALSAPVA